MVEADRYDTNEIVKVFNQADDLSTGYVLMHFPNKQMEADRGLQMGVALVLPRTVLSRAVSTSTRRRDC